MIMKKIMLLLSMLLFVGSIFGQGIVYQEGFESYPDSSSIDTLGYIVNRGTCFVVNKTIHEGEESYLGNNFLRCKPADHGKLKIDLRKKLVLDPGYYNLGMLMRSSNNGNHRGSMKVCVLTKNGDFEGAIISVNSWKLVAAPFYVDERDTVEFYVQVMSNMTLDIDQIILEGEVTTNFDDIDNKIKIYNGYRNIRISSNEPIKKYYVYDMNGLMIMAKNNNNSDCLINFENEESGMYIIKLVDFSGKIHNIKTFIK